MNWRRTLRAWLPAILWMGVIFWLSAQSTLRSPSPHLDETFLEVAGHMVEYAVLALLFFRALRIEEVGSRRALIFAFVAAMLYAFSDEWHQSFVPRRTPSWSDIVADAVGAGTALAGAYVWESLR